MRANAASRLSSILLSDTVETACARLLEALGEMGLDGFCLGASNPGGAPGARFYAPVVWRGSMNFSANSAGQLGTFLDAARGTGWLLVPLGQSEARNWVLAVNRDEAIPADVGAIPLLELFGHALKAIVVPARVLPPATEAAQSPLSTIQLNFLRWSAEGKSSADIAIITGANRRTVEYHFAEILRKLRVSSRAQAIAWLAQSGAGFWPDPEPEQSTVAG
jgi:DNA-binding CsgD family transcriptional regulator